MQENTRQRASNEITSAVIRLFGPPKKVAESLSRYERGKFRARARRGGGQGAGACVQGGGGVRAPVHACKEGEGSGTRCMRGCGGVTVVYGESCEIVVCVICKSMVCVMRVRSMRGVMRVRSTGGVMCMRSTGVVMCTLYTYTLVGCNLAVVGGMLCKSDKPSIIIIIII